MEIYLVAGKDGVDGLPAGVYHYLPEAHRLERLASGDVRTRLAEAALGQRFVAAAPASIVIAADFARTTARYGDRGRRYVYMEAGHVGENVYLQAEADGLATVSVGAFREEAVAEVCGLPGDLELLYIMPVGVRPPE
jgi:SagB-type dehydrogenase family enzyme